MATFTNYSNLLPDPNNSIAADGSTTSSNTGYSAGPGFASVSLKSELPAQTTRTNSGSAIVRNIQGHKWNMSITYNALTRAQFEPLYAFLLQQKGATSSFFAELPQYKTVQNAAWNTFLTTGNNSGAQLIKTTAAVAAGKDNFLITNSSGTTLDSTGSSSQGTPSIGDIFSVVDANNSNHVKVYMITRVETNANHNTAEGAVSASQMRLHFTPGLQKEVSASNSIKFNNVQFRVLNKTKEISYNLDVNNLYKISLNLEEAQP